MDPHAQYSKIIYVDIDNTITITDDMNYVGAVPIQSRIDKINRLYDEGCNYIVYWTARGTCSGIDWTSITTDQLNEWGCRYHKLVMKKPYYDLFIDDKNINSETFFNNI